MAIGRYLDQALRGLWPRFGGGLPGGEELFGKLAALAVLALFLYLLRVGLRALSDRFVGRFGARVRSVVAWLWNLLFLTALAAVFSALFGVGQPAGVWAVGLKLLLAYLVWLGIEAWLEFYLVRRGVDPNLVLLARYTAMVVVVAWTAYMVAGREIAPLIGALGVAGLAVSLAAQDTFSNFIAGVVILLDRPFRIGDWVRLGGKLGRIEGITLRTTRIRTPDNELIALPNSKVAASEVQNLSAGGPLRIHVPVGIAYGADLARARRVLLGVLKEHPAIRHRPAPEVWVRELGDSSVNLELVGWIPEERIAHLPRLAAELTEAAKLALDRAGIAIPFPQRTLWFAEPLRIVQERASQSGSTSE